MSSSQERQNMGDIVLSNVDVLSNVCDFLGTRDITSLRKTCNDTKQTSRSAYQLQDSYLKEKVPSSYDITEYQDFIRQSPTPPKIRIDMVVDESENLSVYNCCLIILN